MYKRIHCRRLFKVQMILILLLTALLFRVSYFQLFKRSYYKNLADKQYYYQEKISDFKYQLLDTKGKYLNTTNEKYAVVLDIRLFKLNNYESKLNDIMALNYIIKGNDEKFDINEVLNKDSGKVYVDINESSFIKIQDVIKDLKGVYTWRYDTIDRNDSWNIVNVINNMYNWNNEKKDENSIESFINTITGENIKPEIKFQVDKSGFIKEAGYNVPEKGNVVLTLDNELQDSIKKVLNSDKFNKFQQIGVVLIESNTGKVKAFTQKNDKLPNVNIAASLQGYPPGSTFKLITAELALEKGIVSKDNKYICAGKYCKKNNKPHAHGSINIEQAINYSCNDFFIELGNKINAEEIINYAKKQGYSSKVLGFYDEAAGIINKPEKVELNNNLILGYSLSATPIQVAGAISPILNEGNYVKPYIIEKIKDSNDNTIKEFQGTVERVMSKNTAEDMKYFMRSTVTKGTGSIANINGMEVGGKTGTASSLDGEVFHTHGWFAGYYKKDNKYYTLVVFVPNIDGKNELGEEYQGSNTAGVVFKDILLTIK
ncbi:Cell division protein FtsI/penicillin-binding protein 2 [Clostridium amylolyticum]|uniref:Cell division protein FtsI/penicillin-binding protein 2 n=1 Tax=Clostridium amylolyticum TaxID=1121298 RepID=A0A1M6D172_9CLOT|nr:penicillin-binding transpeptidase domain-containing protein [Clostridium amylolyticum]SHI67007.1 Cell division protein FtsI/penicillin-binding protein 2 [Clostridium amylolyticum]